MNSTELHNLLKYISAHIDHHYHLLYQYRTYCDTRNYQKHHSCMYTNEFLLPFKLRCDFWVLCPYLLATYAHTFLLLAALQYQSEQLDSLQLSLMGFLASHAFFLQFLRSDAALFDFSRPRAWAASNACKCTIIRLLIFQLAKYTSDETVKDLLCYRI